MRHTANKANQCHFVIKTYLTYANDYCNPAFAYFSSS